MSNMSATSSKPNETPMQWWKCITGACRKSQYNRLRTLLFNMGHLKLDLVSTTPIERGEQRNYSNDDLRIEITIRQEQIYIITVRLAPQHMTDETFVFMRQFFFTPNNPTFERMPMKPITGVVGYRVPCARCTTKEFKI